MSAENIVVLRSEDFMDEVSEPNIPVLVDFWAEWCGPCKMMSPAVEELSLEYGEKAKICKVNIDDYPEIARQFRILSIPTFIVFKNGEIVNKRIGGMSKEELKAMVDEFIEE